MNLYCLLFMFLAWSWVSSPFWNSLQFVLRFPYILCNLSKWWHLVWTPQPFPKCCLFCSGGGGGRLCIGGSSPGPPREAEAEEKPGPCAGEGGKGSPAGRQSLGGVLGGQAARPRKAGPLPLLQGGGREALSPPEALLARALGREGALLPAQPPPAAAPGLVWGASGRRGGRLRRDWGLLLLLFLSGSQAEEEGLPSWGRWRAGAGAGSAGASCWRRRRGCRRWRWSRSGCCPERPRGAGCWRCGPAGASWRCSSTPVRARLPGWSSAEAAPGGGGSRERPAGRCPPRATCCCCGGGGGRPPWRPGRWLPGKEASPWPRSPSGGRRPRAPPGRTPQPSPEGCLSSPGASWRLGRPSSGRCGAPSSGRKAWPWAWNTPCSSWPAEGASSPGEAEGESPDRPPPWPWALPPCLPSLLFLPSLLLRHGQLGHGGLESWSEPEPVEALQGLPVEAVAAGGWHSAALTDAGDLYLWGWNEAGQLALPSKALAKAEDQDGAGAAEKGPPDPLDATFVSIQAFPALLDLPDEAEVLKVSCGSRHTAALTRAGDLYTWGWGQYGQLGHGDTASSDRPRKVGCFADWDLRVVDVTCGPWATYVQAERRTTDLSLDRPEA